MRKENEETVKKYEELARLHKEKLELREKNLVVDRSSGTSYCENRISVVNLENRSSKMDLVNRFKNKLKDFVSKYDQIMKDIEKLNLSR
jgi:hypothetical protein